MSATVTNAPAHIEGQEQIEPGMGDRERPLLYLPIEQIHLGKNPRKKAAEPALAALTDSAERWGFLQTVLVRRTAEDEYELLAGSRRYSSALRAGKSTLPAMVLEPDEALDEPTRLAMAYAENAFREALKPLEEAEILTDLISGAGFSLDDAADHIGMTTELAAARIELLDLPVGVRERLARKELSLSNAATLAPIAAKAPGVAEALAERVSSGAQGQSALDEDPAAALRRLADEERQPEGVFLIPFGAHDTVNLDEVCARIRSAAADELILESGLGEVERALDDVRESLASIPTELRTAHIGEAEADRARAFGALIEYREGAYRRSGVLIDPEFAADWARGVAAELAKTGGETELERSAAKLPEEREDAKAERERRMATVLQAKSSNSHLDRELTHRFDHQTEVPMDQAVVIGAVVLEAMGRELASGHRVVREGWMKRDIRAGRGGSRIVEEYPSLDEAIRLLEAHWRKAPSGSALIGRIFAAVTSAVCADQRVLGAAARPNFELPHALGREEQLQGQAPEAFFRQAEVCLGEVRAAELRPKFTALGAANEASRDRLAHDEDLAGEALELLSEADVGEGTVPIEFA